jgi:hypothetical protein
MRTCVDQDGAEQTERDSHHDTHVDTFSPAVGLVIAEARAITDDLQEEPRRHCVSRNTTNLLA